MGIGMNRTDKFSLGEKDAQKKLIKHLESLPDKTNLIQTGQT